MTPPANKTSKIRVGLMIDAYLQPKWVKKILDDLETCPFAEVSLIIKNEAPAPSHSFWTRLQISSHLWLYSLYRKFDEKRFKRQPDAFEPVDISIWAKSKSIITVCPEQKKYSDYFPANDLKKIREAHLDVLFRRGFRILKGEILQAARYGVWSYHHGDNHFYRGGPAGFWEVMENNPVTGSILQILTEKLDSGKVLYRSWAPTAEFSVYKNRNNFYWKSSCFFLRKIKDLYNQGPQALETAETSGSLGPVYREPGNRQMAGLFARLAGRYVKDRISHFLYPRQWRFAYQLSDTTQGPSHDFSQFREMVPLAGNFWADPFPVIYQGRPYIFFEEHSGKNGKGHISVTELFPDSGQHSAPAKVLEQPYHLSYPFIFQWKGEFFMIPETAANKSIEIYRCQKFPYEWSLEKTLMQNVNAADATLVEIDGLWWLFVNMAVTGALNHDELFLFYSDNPLGTWKEHPLNPIVSDARKSRPAGRLFLKDGKWHRPAQDCSGSYGRAISINQILKINREEYKEREVSRITPDWKKNLAGTHTFNHAEGITVIDYLLKQSCPGS